MNKVLLKHDKSKIEEQKKQKEEENAFENIKTIFVFALLITNTLTIVDIMLVITDESNEYSTLRIASGIFEVWTTLILVLGYYFSQYFDCVLECDTKFLAYLFSFCGCYLLFGGVFLVFSYILQIFSFVFYYKNKHRYENEYTVYLLYSIFIFHSITIFFFCKVISYTRKKMKKSKEKKKND